MLTIQTCTTADLERLCRQYSNPATLEESAILKGAKSELADRNLNIIEIRSVLGEHEYSDATWDKSVAILTKEADALRA